MQKLFKYLSFSSSKTDHKTIKKKKKNFTDVIPNNNSTKHDLSML